MSDPTFKDDIALVQEESGHEDAAQDTNENVISASPSVDTPLLKNRKIMCRVWPRSIIFILGNEFCERFTYYGMRTVLTLFLISKYHMSNNDASAVYSAFSMLCYFSPILGAWIADQYLGRYKTILYVSLLYVVGNFVLALSSATVTLGITLLGLFLIAMGTGGIKPCVGAFGGDQFIEGEERLRERFFYYFYVAINCGSLLSIAVTPILRSEVKCLGAADCYPLAFGVPAILMLVAVGLFIFGTGYYVMVPPNGNALGKLISISFAALFKKIRSFRNSETPKNHWLDYAPQAESRDEKEREFIQDCKSVYQVLWLFLPLPAFWALYDQQGDSWIIQAKNMSGYTGINNYTIKADQIQIINPLLIVILIPLFDFAVYPLLTHFRIPHRPLQRMVVGMALGAVAFFMSGLLQIIMDSSALKINMFWQLPQYFVLTVGEILFSPTGLSFAFAEAPDSMKSVMQAAWLLTVSIGDLIDLIAFSSNAFTNYIVIYFLFGGVLTILTLIFALLTRFYTYRDTSVYR